MQLAKLVHELADMAGKADRRVTVDAMAFMEAYGHIHHHRQLTPQLRATPQVEAGRQRSDQCQQPAQGALQVASVERFRGSVPLVCRHQRYRLDPHRLRSR